MNLRIPTFSEIQAVSQTRGAMSETPHLWDGLVGWWPLNEGGGDMAFDASGWGNHGVHSGGLTHTVGEKGRCLEFDGTDDYVDPSASISSLDGLTVSAWLKWSHSNSFSAYFGVGNEPADNTSLFFGMNHDGNANDSPGDLMCFLEAGTMSPLGGTAGASFNDGEWHHVVWGLIGPPSGTSDISLFVDGIEQSIVFYDSSMNGDDLTAPIPYFIGAYNGEGSASGHAEVQLNNVTIHNRALSPSEIQQLYTDPWVMGRRRPTMVAFSAGPSTNIAAIIHHRQMIGAA